MTAIDRKTLTGEVGMSAKTYMIAGSFFGVGFGLVGCIPNFSSPQLLVILFACGALFGKGYGIWEERERRRSALRQSTEAGGE